ncbi:MAG: HEAT repeat domain-containing protein [Oscillatoriales cyanobacterium RU_3_3]|nr:HEAT repeat domain-containing protein [Oscillatoriales cyanobacterium RU_3_3]
MSNVITQAQIAADRQNWSELVQCLQQIPAGERKPDARQQPTVGEQIELLPAPEALELAVSLAIEVLARGDFQDRWDVAKILPNFGTRAIAPLIEILEDENADPEQRWFAARILGKFDRPEVILALAKQVKNPDEELSQIAAETLANVGPKAIDSLANLLLQEDSRLFATAALAQIRRSETITPLLSVVRDSQAAVRATAIEALSSFHDYRIAPVLVAALNDPATAVRKEAVRALGVRPYLDPELDLVKLLAPLLWDISLEVCSCAANAVGRLKTDAAAAALLKLLRSPATPIPLQIEAIRALGWIETPVALDCLQQVLIARSTQESENGVSLNSTALTASESSANDRTKSTICREIVTILGRVEKPEIKVKAAEILINLLETNHPALQRAEIKQSIALGLGQLRDMRAIDPLIQMLANADNGIRLHCTAALKQLSTVQARQQLENLAKQNNLEPGFKQGIAIALEELPPN